MRTNAMLATVTTLPLAAIKCHCLCLRVTQRLPMHIRLWQKLFSAFDIWLQHAHLNNAVMQLVCYLWLYYMPKAHTAVVRNHFFSEITPTSRNRLGRHFTGRRKLKLLVPSAKPAKESHFARFLSTKQCIVSPTSRQPISVKFEHKTWTGVTINSFGNRIAKFVR